MSFINYLISVNSLAFFLILIDKKKAIHHKWRIAENILLLVSILGGCFGMIISMYLFHHKTKKSKFKLVPIICFCWSYLIFSVLFS